MSDQASRAQAFRALHVAGRPLVLFNVWDAGSAKAVAASAVAAVATGSWSVAAAHGFEDGERMPLDLAIANLRRIAGAVELPVTIDLESGYGADAQAVGETVARVLAAGAVGCNLEDSFPDSGTLRPAAEQVERIEAARVAADQAAVPAFINARTDVFLQAPGEAHDEALVTVALERARAYAAAGADGLFAPGLTSGRLIAQLVEGSPSPVNIMAGGRTSSLAELAGLGVARVSHGPEPYKQAMMALEAAARAAAA